MKKIKIERTSNKTGERGEIVALTTTAPPPPVNHRQAAADEQLQEDDLSPKKVGDESIIQEQLVEPFVDTKPIIEQQNQQQQENQQQQSNQHASQPQPQQQQQQQQFPNIQRSLPPGAPANYCNYCKKELCNKYFMKTHMRKMHNINLDDYPRDAASSGGVVCDICQKELCSKYFLKVHKLNTHGIQDFTSGSAGSQAANAATAVAAIALTNYSLNNAQKRAALNLALNQHQLQSRQAAALIGGLNAAASAAFNPLHMAQAAKAAAIHQRDHFSTSTLIGQLTQHSNQQHQPPSHQLQPQIDLHLQKQHQQQSQQTQLQSPLNNPTSTSSATTTAPPPAAASLAAFPAALLAATASNPLLAAQLAQQHHQFAPHNGQQPPPLGRQQQQQPQQHQPLPLFFPLNEDPLDTEEDTSDRDSAASADTQSADQQHRNRLAMNNFHQHLQNQQALLNAAAVFNPAAAAAAVMAMQQQQHHLQQQQHHLQQQRQQQQQQQLSMGNRQQTAIDLRNQSISQLIAQQMISPRVQNEQQQLVNNCNTTLNIGGVGCSGGSSNDNNIAQFPASQLYHQEDDLIQQQLLQQEPQQAPINVGEDVDEEHPEDDEDDDFDSDRDSLVDEGVFRQAAVAAASAAASTITANGQQPLGVPSATTISSLLPGDSNSMATSINNNVNGSPSGSSIITNENDIQGMIVNCSTDLKNRSALNLAHHTNTTNNTTTSSNTTNTKQPFRSGTMNKQLNRTNNSDPFPPTSNSNNILHSQMSNLLNANPSPLAATNLAAIQRTTTTSSTLSSRATTAANESSGAITTTANNRSSNNNTNNGGGASNSNSSSRYLRHYTEMCPICDRRFKSIKWLQSHVMNDHKNEIGNQLFNLLVQILLCSNNNNGSGGSTASDANGSSNQSASGPLNASGSGGSMAGFSETLAGYVGADLQQQLATGQQQQQPQLTNNNQITGAASTANRGDV